MNIPPTVWWLFGGTVLLAFVLGGVLGYYLGGIYFLRKFEEANRKFLQKRRKP